MATPLVAVPIRAVGRLRAVVGSIALLLTFGGSAVALVMPFFNDFLSLTGALLSGPISFFLPMIFFIGTMRKIRKQQSPDGEGIDLQSSTTPMVRSHEARQLGETRNGDPEKTPLTDGLSVWDVLTWVVAGTIVLFTMFIGTYDSISSMVQRSADAGGLFSCKALNTTDLR